MQHIEAHWFWREVTYMRALQHPNIISIYSYFIVSPSGGIVDQWKEAENAQQAQPAAAALDQARDSPTLVEWDEFSFGSQNSSRPCSFNMNDFPSSSSGSARNCPDAIPNSTQFHVLDDDVMIIIMEYANAGNLNQEMMRYPGKTIPVPGVHYYMNQILAGVKYMHDKRISHNDLHLENIFLSFDPDARTKTCKIADFGLADQFPVGKECPIFELMDIQWIFAACCVTC